MLTEYNYILSMSPVAQVVIDLLDEKNFDELALYRKSVPHI